MSRFTYEPDSTTPLETYEWDNVWWEQTNSTEKGRIMYIGDSISCGIRYVWNNLEGIEWYCDNCGTSKAIDNPYLLPLAVSFGRQQKSCDAILINNGLHGAHLSVEQYAEHYEKFLCGLKAEFSDRPIFVVTSTSVSDVSQNSNVIARNTAVNAIAEKHGVKVIDLYPLSSTLVHTDGVHLDNDGYLALTEHIRNELKKLI